MSEPITYVGIDAHKSELQVAVLAPDTTEPTIWTVRNEARTVDRLRRRLEKVAPGPIACCYEAGPCGYALQRQLERGRVRCDVIAPALVPRKPGDRIKTDRRDARKLAELHRASLLTVVRAPTPAEEAVRDLCRARDDARADRQRCRHRPGKLLLRRGLHYAGRAWTQAHRRWINGLTWSHPADRVVVDDYLLAIDHLEARLLELDAQLVTVADTDPYREPVGWLRCFRGIDTLTAVLLLAELHDVVIGRGDVRGELIEVSDALCQTRLSASCEDAAEAAKKKTSGKGSRPRSTPKSKRSWAGGGRRRAGFRGHRTGRPRAGSSLGGPGRGGPAACGPDRLRGPDPGVRAPADSVFGPDSRFSLTANPAPSSGTLRAGRGMPATPPQRPLAADRASNGREATLKLRKRLLAALKPF